MKVLCALVSVLLFAVTAASLENEHWAKRYREDCDTGAITQTPIKVGETLPGVTLVTLGHHQLLEKVKSEELVEDKRVVFLSVSGAFHPESASHLKEYVKGAYELLKGSVDTVAIVTTEDPYVVQGKLFSHLFNDIPHVQDALKLSDGNLEFGKAVGLVDDRRDEGFGLRLRCFSMIVDDGVVVAVNTDDEHEGHVLGESHLQQVFDQLETLPPRK